MMIRQGSSSDTIQLRHHYIVLMRSQDQAFNSPKDLGLIRSQNQASEPSRPRHQDQVTMIRHRDEVMVESQNRKDEASQLILQDDLEADPETQNRKKTLERRVDRLILRFPSELGSEIQNFAFYKKYVHKDQKHVPVRLNDKESAIKMDLKCVTRTGQLERDKNLDSLMGKVTIIYLHEAKPEEDSSVSGQKKPAPPKKPLSRYFIYLNEVRDQFRTKHPEKKPIELSKIITEAFKDLSVQERMDYEEKAQKLKAAYDQEITIYVATYGPLPEKVEKIPDSKNAKKVKLNKKDDGIPEKK